MKDFLRLFLGLYCITLIIPIIVIIMYILAGIVGHEMQTSIGSFFNDWFLFGETMGVVGWRFQLAIIFIDLILSFILHFEE